MSVKQNKIKKYLQYVYGKDIADKTFPKITNLIEKYSKKIPKSKKELFSQKDAVLITYADSLKLNNKKPLRVLCEFNKKYLKNIINTIHILPFYPYSSDDGFSVIDFKKVKPEHGTFKDIANLNKDTNLMYDLVLNHISAKSKWFSEYKKGNPKYKDFFIEQDKDIDISKVTRPRALPLLTKVNTKKGRKYVWTTFSADQIDLNFANPDVLIAMLDIFLFYISKGAKIIRLDAIAYLWKELGTSCIHLKKTHEVVKLFRDVSDIIKPDTIILTETNVPHKENISYFGNNNDEAHMIYQFSLPPLTAHAILKQDCSYLLKWAQSVSENISSKITYFNFLASHDGIGVRPASGIIPDKEIDFLAQTAVNNGGRVSYKDNGNGTKSPYELNITYFDLISNKNDSIEINAQRFIAVQAVMLSLAGIPGIYIHSLLGSQNDIKGMEKSNIARRINREKLNYKRTVKELEQEDSLRCLIYNKYKNLLKIRSGCKAFHPNAGQKIINIDKRIFSLIRTSKDKKQKILVLINFSSKPVSKKIDLKKIGLNSKCAFKELVSGREIVCSDNRLNVTLQGFAVWWVVLS